MKTISCLPRQGRSRVLSPSFATCLLLLPVAHASTQLPEVVVTSSRTEQLQTDTLLHTTVITADRIRQSQQQDLPSLLAMMALTGSFIYLLREIWLATEFMNTQQGLLKRK